MTDGVGFVGGDKIRQIWIRSCLLNLTAQFVLTLLREPPLLLYLDNLHDVSGVKYWFNLVNSRHFSLLMSYESPLPDAAWYHPTLGITHIHTTFFRLNMADSTCGYLCLQSLRFVPEVPLYFFFIENLRLLMFINMISWILSVSDS